MQSQINTTPIVQFLQILKSAELSQAKEVKMSIQQARLVHIALTELMNKVNQDYESMLNELKKSVDSDVITVQLDGGGFDSK
jgi:hypothetical protein